MWKLLLALLLNRGKIFIKGVRFRGKLYIISVKEYISVTEQMEKWRSALNVKDNQST